MFSNRWEFKVRFGETDAAGIVFYPNFYKWMDQATHELLGAAGYSTRKLLEEHKGFPLVEANCQFRKPLQFDDSVKLVSTVAEVKNKVIKIAHQFYREEALIAEGFEVRAWADFSEEQMKAVPIPDPLRQALLSEDRPVKL
jgi:4-hydroxybenzoyl-CoA thioesterase